MEGKFAESIETYQQVYDRFPNLTDGVPASTALCMMGSAYRELGQPQKAVEVLRKQQTEYGHLGGREYPYYSLGCAYLDMGDKEKALEAFEQCLAIGAGRHGPDEYPLKHAREQIDQMKGQ
jgi:tetratricopeptide (TPR) repeat protein